MIRSTFQVFEQAWNYYRLYGAKRFLWAVNKRLRRRSQVQTHLLFDNPEVSRNPIIPTNVFLRTKKVCIIGDLNLPQCKKYRVVQKLEALDALEVSHAFSHWEDLQRSLNIIQLASLVIFYRTGANGTFQILVEECVRLGIPYIYDIDDPIFSQEIYRENENLKFISKREKNILLASSRLYVKAMRACQGVIVSTPRLAAEVESLGIEKTYLWRNAVDLETANASRRALDTIQSEQDISNTTVKIIYASGSRAHEADFRLIEQVLVDAMSRQNNVHLIVIGHLEIPDSFKEFSDRIKVIPFRDYDQYIIELAAADIAIIPLLQDDFNDCKSAIRYMEAALVELPVIVSRTGDFVNLVQDGKTGILANDSKAWHVALETLIADEALRRRIGSDARQSVLSELSVDQIAYNLDSELKHQILGK